MKPIAITLFFTFFCVMEGVQVEKHAAACINKKIPTYAEWGNLAMEKTKERYPQAAVIDYLHIGKVQTQNNSVEKFKLWLKEGKKEFGVFVNIEFNTETKKVVSITYRESQK
jgi:hypothetical protein